jgi:hypothetical protein
MAERELSTRDLAGTSAEDAPASDKPERIEAPRSDATDDANEAPDGAAAASSEQDGPDGVDETSATDVSGGTVVPEDEQGPLLPEDQSDRFVTRWREIQTGFVDEPRESVAQADALVADLMQRLAASFSDAREGLEAQWDRGNDVSTEELRVALRRYRAFFDRLLSA